MLTDGTVVMMMNDDDGGGGDDGGCRFQSVFNQDQ